MSGLGGGAVTVFYYPRTYLYRIDPGTFARFSVVQVATSSSRAMRSRL